MAYGYARVSISNQHIDRQIEALKKEGLEDSQIYINYESEKDFERTEYRKLKKKLKVGGLLRVKSIDRLVRNYQMILDEWRIITKEIKADIKVINMHF